jgi:hypothetical protein
MNINFNNFINEFYSNYNNNKIILELNIDNSDTNIYDIHNMLLDLLIKGYEKFNTLDLQHFFNNIDIQVNVENLTKKDLLDNQYNYINRYIKFNIDNLENMIINGSHQIVKNLKEIISFCLIDDNNNLKISFNSKIC